VHEYTDRPPEQRSNVVIMFLFQVFCFKNQIDPPQPSPTPSILKRRNASTVRAETAALWPGNPMRSRRIALFAGCMKGSEMKTRCFTVRRISLRANRAACASPPPIVQHLVVWPPVAVIGLAVASHPSQTQSAAAASVAPRRVRRSTTLTALLHAHARSSRPTPRKRPSSRARRPGRRKRAPAAAIGSMV